MIFSDIHIIEHNAITPTDEKQMAIFTKTLNNWYPIGCNKFTIDYTDNYFNFVKTIGESGFHIVYKNTHSTSDSNVYICGSLCFRYVRSAWYLCDLKIDPKYRGKRVTYKFILKKLLHCWWKTGRAYAISMYPNKAVEKLNTNFKLLNMKNMGFVYIYLVDYNDIILIYDKLVRHYKHKYNGFVNMSDKKKIIFDTGEELNVLHFYHNDNINHMIQLVPFDDLEKQYVNFKYFFCVLEKDLHILNLSCKHYGLGTLYARKMDINEFNDLGTYEI